MRDRLLINAPCVPLRDDIMPAAWGRLAQEVGGEDWVVKGGRRESGLAGPGAEEESDQDPGLVLRDVCLCSPRQLLLFKCRVLTFPVRPEPLSTGRGQAAVDPGQKPAQRPKSKAATFRIATLLDLAVGAAILGVIGSAMTERAIISSKSF